MRRPRASAATKRCKTGRETAPHSAERTAAIPKSLWAVAFGLLAVLASWLLPLSPPRATAGTAAPPQEIGVDERLGAQVPMDLVLTDENGKPVALGSLIDKPTILTLNYFRCVGICTPILNSLASTANKLPIEPGRDFRILTVSFDDRDTPEIAFGKRTNYLKQMSRPFPPSAWRFLTGTEANTRKLCDAVGFKFKKQGEDFIHPGVILVLSPKGIVTKYMYGITYLPADVQMALEDGLKGRPVPSVNRLTGFCYSYDPQGRKYVFDFTKAAGLLILLLAASFAAYLFLKGRSPKESAAGNIP